MGYRNVGLISATAGTTLTAGYVAGTVHSVKHAKEAVLQIGYTMGSAETSNSIEVKIEWLGLDGATYYRDCEFVYDPQAATSGGTATVALHEFSFAAVSAAATYDYFTLKIPILGEKLKVSFKETGKASNFGTVKAGLGVIE